MKPRPADSDKLMQTAAKAIRSARAKGWGWASEDVALIEPLYREIVRLRREVEALTPRQKRLI